MYYISRLLELLVLSSMLGDVGQLNVISSFSGLFRKEKCDISEFVDSPCDVGTQYLLYLKQVIKFDYKYT